MIKQKQKSIGTESIGEISNLFLTNGSEFTRQKWKPKKEDAKVDQYGYEPRRQNLEPTCRVLDVCSSLALKIEMMLFIGCLYWLPPEQVKLLQLYLPFSLTSLWGTVLSYFILCLQILSPSSVTISRALCGPLCEGRLAHSTLKADPHWGTEEG